MTVIGSDTERTGVPRRATALPRRLAVLAGLVLVVAALVLGPAGLARAAVGERMRSYDVVYDLQPDGSVKVKETVQWQFPSGERRHGIFRNIVARMGVDNQPNVYRAFDLTDVAVSSPTGAPAQFRVSQNGASDEIRIGSADEWTSGTQTYVLSYTLAHVLNPIAESDTVEFHYNVFGTNELTERDKVTVTVNAPAASTDVLCFQGPGGSHTPCQAQKGEPTTFGAQSLASGDAMTVIAQYPATAFNDPQPDIRQGDAGAGVGENAAPATNVAAFAAGIGAPLIAAAVMGALVWTRGRDEHYVGVTPGLTPAAAGAAGARGAPGVPAPSIGGAVPAPTRRGGRQTVAVQFQPPQGVQPGLVGTVIDETANPIDVSATVIDLAVRGYLRIEETPGTGLFARTDWTMARLEKPRGQRLLPYEAKLLADLFSDGDVVKLSDLKNHFSGTLSSVQQLMYEEVVQRGWFRQSPQRQRGAWRALGSVVGAAGAIVLFFGHEAVQSVLGADINGVMVLGVGLVLAGVITALLGSRMAHKTAAGSAVHAQSLGFKEYLLTAEAGQIEFEEASNIFSRYLPYAVVFGVADRWAKVFADVARAAEAAGQSLVMPTWYVWSGNAFPDFASIASGVDNFSTTSTGTFTSTPGSSGASGFSGGGFSGSGGGGSSSGSW
jgi:uncharacterized membrane protein YgcG